MNFYSPICYLDYNRPGLRSKILLQAEDLSLPKCEITCYMDKALCVYVCMCVFQKSRRLLLEDTQRRLLLPFLTWIDNLVFWSWSYKQFRLIQLKSYKHKFFCETLKRLVSFRRRSEFLIMILLFHVRNLFESVIYFSLFSSLFLYKTDWVEFWNAKGLSCNEVNFNACITTFQREVIKKRARLLGNLLEKNFA